jgi:hypothetical protein
MVEIHKKQATFDEFFDKLINVAREHNVNLYNYITKGGLLLNKLIDDLFEMGVIDEEMHNKFFEIFE